MNNKNKNSIGMFDITRGMLMIAVVLGHSITAYVKYWEPQFTMHWWYCFLILFKHYRKYMEASVRKGCSLV